MRSAVRATKHFGDDSLSCTFSFFAWLHISRAIFFFPCLIRFSRHECWGW
jgi:hypothetical protein